MFFFIFVVHLINNENEKMSRIAFGSFNFHFGIGTKQRKNKRLQNSDDRAKGNWQF
jgi:hypothetical protein